MKLSLRMRDDWLLNTLFQKKKSLYFIVYYIFNYIVSTESIPHKNHYRNIRFNLSSWELFFGWLLFALRAFASNNILWRFGGGWTTVFAFLLGPFWTFPLFLIVFLFAILFELILKLLFGWLEAFGVLWIIRDWVCWQRLPKFFTDLLCSLFNVKSSPAVLSLFRFFFDGCGSNAVSHDLLLFVSSTSLWPDSISCGFVDDFFHKFTLFLCLQKSHRIVYEWRM